MEHATQEQPPDSRRHYTLEQTESNPERLIEQSQRIGDTLRVFVDEKLMSDHAVDVARLQSLIDITRDESASAVARHQAAWEVMDYMTDPKSPVDTKEVDYMFALWSDLVRIDTAAGNYRNRLEEENSDESQRALRKLDGTISIEKSDWHDIRVGVDVPKIVKLSKEVNVESILARSSLLLDRVATATTYDNEVLKDILEIETVYAPLLDLLGLHAWEAILRHHTEKARLLAAGFEKEYTEAAEYIEQARNDGLYDVVMSDVIGIPDLSKDKFGFIVDNEETPYGSKSYFSATRFTSSGGVPARLISRIKSPGSHAHKKTHNPKYKDRLPQDVYAGTLVTGSLEEMVSLFKETLSNIESLDTCELVAAPSKTRSLYVKGKQEYVDAVKASLGKEFEGLIDDGDVVPDDVEEPFQVLRVTFTMQVGDAVLPVEIQFQTTEDRNRSRLGGASHLCFKGKTGKGMPGNIPGDSNDLWEVNLNRYRMHEGGERIYLSKDEETRALQLQGVRELQTKVLEVSSDEYVAHAA